MTGKIAAPDDAETLNWDELSRLRLFENVGLESVEGLLAACPVRQLQPGEILISVGQANDTMYLLLSGRLRVHLDSVDSEPVDVLDAGESVGELSIIDEKPASAFVVAEQSSRLLAVPKDIFWALTRASHSIACNLLFTLAERCGIPISPFPRANDCSRTTSAWSPWTI